MPATYEIHLPIIIICTSLVCGILVHNIYYSIPVISEYTELLCAYNAILPILLLYYDRWGLWLNGNDQTNAMLSYYLLRYSVHLINELMLKELVKLIWTYQMSQYYDNITYVCTWIVRTSKFSVFIKHIY